MAHFPDFALVHPPFLGVQRDGCRERAGGRRRFFVQPDRLHQVRIAVGDSARPGGNYPPRRGITSAGGSKPAVETNRARRGTIGTITLDARGSAMAHWPLNWNVVRPDLVVGSGPREPSDLDVLRLETHVSAMSVGATRRLPGPPRHRLSGPRAAWPPARFDDGTLPVARFRSRRPAARPADSSAWIVRVAAPGPPGLRPLHRRDQPVAAGGAGVSHCWSKGWAWRKP